MIEKIDIPAGGFVAATRTERLAGLGLSDLEAVEGAVALALPSHASAEAVARDLPGLPIVVEPPYCTGPLTTTAYSEHPIPLAVVAGPRDYDDEPADRLMSELAGRFRPRLVVIGTGWARPFDVREAGPEALEDVQVVVVGAGSRGHGVLEPDLYRALAAGGAVVARYTPGFADLFGRTEDLDWFTAPGEAAVLAAHYLHRSDLAADMARRGQAWVRARTREAWVSSILRRVSA